MDPRTDITHEIEIGNVYEDDRSDELYRLLYIDDVSALLRCEDGATLLIRRDAFEKEVGASRYTYKPEATIEQHSALRPLSRMLSDFESSEGRTASHKAEALSELSDAIHGNRAEDANETVDFTAVDGIGNATAENLRNAGYSTKGDVRSADRDDLLSVGGVGQTNLDRLLDYVG